ncbi:MAG: FKBP-type peptidyl-prolyl cis-trans isomerase N-terminal domain-containing protein, partial [Longimicrobiales bacterium]
MHRRIGPCLVLSVLALGACGPAGTPSLETEDQKASYGIGHQMGSQLAPAETHIDMDAFLAGVRDGMAGTDPAVSQADIQVALQSLSERVNAEESERMAAEGATNAAEGEAFLAENASKEGVLVTESGLQYEVLREGDGPSPGPEDQVTIHYKGTLIDGTQFDSSYDRGEPATFSTSGVISGFSEGLQLMTVGSQYRFFIPSELGYGPGGSGRVIGPN